MSLGVVAAGVGLALVGRTWLEPALADGLNERAQGWTFWCMLTTALIFGYTSFEVLYRDPLWARLASLPINPRALFGAKVLRVYRRHLPLSFIPVLSGASLLMHGEVTIWATGVTATLLVWTIGLSVSIFAHIWAGQSLVDGANPLKAYLSQGFGPTDAAFLFYSPALALLCTSVVALAVEVGFIAWRVNGTFMPLLFVVLVGFGIALFCLRRASNIFIRWQHMIAPRFTDVEILPTWREGELHNQVFGMKFGDALPQSIRPVWRRLILQYRRRFRVVIPLSVVLCAVLVAFAAGSTTLPVDAWALAAAIGVLIYIPSIRACGAELGFGVEARALPVPRGHEYAVLGLLAVVEWFPLALSVLLGGFLGGQGVEMTAAAAGVLVMGGLINTVAIPASLRLAPRVARVSFALRGVSLLVIGVISSVF
jgi:hypothetical protein